MAEMMSLEELGENLLERNSNGESWADMGREYDVNPAVLWRLVKEGYNPKKEETRKKLGLSELVEQYVYRDNRGRFTGLSNKRKEGG